MVVILHLGTMRMAPLLINNTANRELSALLPHSLTLSLFTKKLINILRMALQPNNLRPVILLSHLLQSLASLRALRHLPSHPVLCLQSVILVIRG